VAEAHGADVDGSSPRSGSGSRPAYRGLPTAGPLYSLQRSKRSHLPSERCTSATRPGPARFGRSPGRPLAALMPSAATLLIAPGPFHRPFSGRCLAVLSVPLFHQSRHRSEMAAWFRAMPIAPGQSPQRRPLAVVYHPLDVTDEKLPLRIEVGARLEARSGACAKLP
jgi:hypothetical protein